MSEDPYLDIANEQHPNLVMFYNMFADKKPVMLFDVQEGKIYAYPYEDFKNDMNERSQTILTEQYQEAQKTDQMVVFIRDNDEKRLVSYTMPRQSEHEAPKPKKLTVVMTEPPRRRRRKRKKK